MQFLIFWTASESDKTPLGLLRLFSPEFPLNPAFGRFFFGKIDFEMKEGPINYVPKVSFFFFFFAIIQRNQAHRKTGPDVRLCFAGTSLDFKMRFTTTCTIDAAKPDKYTLDSGYTQDRTLIFIKTSLGNGVDTSRGVGSISVPYSWGTAENYSNLEKLSFPIRAEVEIEHVTNGKKEDKIIHSLKPVAVSKASSASA